MKLVRQKWHADEKAVILGQSCLANSTWSWSADGKTSDQVDIATGGLEPALVLSMYCNSY